MAKMPSHELRAGAGGMKTIYLPGLNGLRAIAAMAVVVSHTTMALGDFHLNPHLFGTFADGKPRGLNLAGSGVMIFFSLSGFLITYLLLLESRASGINVRNFYIRRILRIWPLYYFYMVLAGATILTLNLNWTWKLLAFYVFYSPNIPAILGTSLPFLQHYWSLGVEEQFYLFWPWLVKAAGGHLKGLLMTLVPVLVAIKYGVHVVLRGSILEAALIITPFQCMMIGGLGALFYYEENALFLKIMTHKVTQGLAWFAVILMGINRFHIASIIDDELTALITVALIMGQVVGERQIINLEREPLAFLGKISYGIYVYHPLIIQGFKSLIGGLLIQDAVKYVFVYVGIPAATVVVAYLSYEVLERRFLRLKQGYSTIPSSATRVPLLG